jgi:hypothetical protein
MLTNSDAQRRGAAIRSIQKWQPPRRPSLGLIRALWFCVQVAITLAVTGAALGFVGRIAWATFRVWR